MTVALVVFAWGDDFKAYAGELVRSARQHWFPDQDRRLYLLEGEPGWPNASACRYRLLLERLHRIEGDHLFMVDADARFEADVGPEILCQGITATAHPGFPQVGRSGEVVPSSHWPYERDSASAAYVPVDQQTDRYYPGAFVGGERSAFRDLLAGVSGLIAVDERQDFRQPGGRPLARWYDESYLNRWLVDRPPALVLPGSYCYWDYWGPAPGPNGERRILVHLDKTADEFDRRGQAA